MPHARVHRLPMRGPDDAAPIEAAIRAGSIDPAAVLAIRTAVARWR